MNWDEALRKFMSKHWDAMGQREFEAMYGYPWDGFSIAGLWSYRGAIWVRYEGCYPKPEDVGLEPDHWFFNPDVVCLSETRKQGGEVIKREQRHHGRKMKPTHRLYDPKWV